MLQHFAKILQESQPQHRLGRHGTSYKSHKDGKPTKSQATSHGSNNNPSKSHHQPNEPQGQGTDGESYKESHNRLSPSGMENTPQEPRKANQSDRPRTDEQHPTKSHKSPRGEPTDQPRTDTRRTPSNTHTRLRPCTANGIPHG